VTRIMKNRMINVGLLTGLALGLGLGTGCVFSIGGSEERPSRHEVSKHEPSPVVVMPANTEDAATLAEIDAAGSLSFDNGRVPALKNVAVRPNLSAPIQVHLINVALNRLSFDVGKEEVLLALIQNPSFSPAGKETVLRRLNSLQFDASRTRILNAIQERSAAK
jgi:hypothetical protein